MISAYNRSTIEPEWIIVKVLDVVAGAEVAESWEAGVVVTTNLPPQANEAWNGAPSVKRDYKRALLYFCTSRTLPVSTAALSMRRGSLKVLVRPTLGYFGVR